ASGIDGYAVAPGIQADEVQRDGFEDVFQAGLGQSAVAGLPGVGDLDRLGDGGFGAGAAGVLDLPGGGGLLHAGVVESFLHRPGTKGQLSVGVGGGGALCLDRALGTGLAVEPDHDHLGAALTGGSPRGAGLALRASDLLSIPVDGERGAVVSGTGASLR